MADYTQSAGIMYPANWPEDVDDAHCTLIYLGDKNVVEEKAHPGEISVFLESLNLTEPGEVRLQHTEFFGPNKDIPVVTLDSGLLHLQRVLVEEGLLKEFGIVNGSEFKEFKPHVSVKAGSTYDIPLTVKLGRPALWWGGEKFTV